MTTRDRVDEFVRQWEALRKNYYQQNFETVRGASLEVSEGKKYYKVTADGSVMAFIDKVTGDIYMPASWAKPAKHVRGNVNAEDYGISCTTPYGIKYLKHRNYTFAGGKE